VRQIESAKSIFSVVFAFSSSHNRAKRSVSENHRGELLKLYELYPFHHHPMWTAVKCGTLSYEQVIRAEIQHCIRTRAGRILREKAVQTAEKLNEKLFRMLVETYLEECTDKAGPSHLDLIERLVLLGGATRADIDQATATPGNSAAIALYRDISDRGAGCHMLGAGVVEFYYSQLAPNIFESYTKTYGMSEEQALTYKLHGPMDHTHAERAFAVLEEVIELHGWRVVYGSVRDAFVATSLHYDGMYQAATGTTAYWNGRKQ
jgi:pyrroloquinoline quinone (PQQ) biosynthesis protein C